MENLSSTSKPIDRVALACIQCRSRHVKCDSNQPMCNRCKRDGKECTYLKSRRGGLDKAALARRRLALQQKQQQQQSLGETSDQQSTTGSSNSGGDDHLIIPNSGRLDSDISNIPSLSCSSSALSFTIRSDRLIELYYENFYPSNPLTLPIHFLRERMRHRSHQMENLLLVIQWIGAIYAPWTPSEAFYQQAYQALLAPTLPKNGFSVQALLLFSIAQHHSDMRPEARKMLDAAITLGLELSMNTREFIRQYGEMNPVLEESWRRTFYFLLLTDQHYSVTTSNPFYRMQGVPNQVDLPCDNEYYEAGQIPLPATLEEYDRRDFADVEVVYSSLTYLYDISRVIEYIMRTFVETGSFSEDLIFTVEAKVAVWKSLLPICKKDPLRPDGTVDEIMYLAHLISAIVLMNTHRPLSSLNYSLEELSVSSFSAPALFIDPPRHGRAGHTARALKAAEIQTKLLAIACPIQKHHPFTMCISASLAAAQIAACNTLLEDRALSIARDRVRLSIGTLNAMAGIWPLAKNMAKDVRYIARMTLSGATSSHTIQFEPAQDEVENPKEEIIWPLNPSTDIDIYSGIVLPMDSSPSSLLP